MRYHILVSSAAAPEEKHLASKDRDLGILRSVHTEHKATLKKDVLHLSGIAAEAFKALKSNKQERLLSKIQNYPIPFYFFDEMEMKKLAAKIQPDDSLVFHGDGSIFTIGLSEPSGFDLTPLKLAKRLADYQFPQKIPFSIELMACNLGSTWHGLNFAQILSLGLKYIYDFRELKVIAYAGYILENRTAGKYSIALDIERKKGQHAPLEAARVTYLSGQVFETPKKRANLDGYELSWASSYIKQVTTEKKNVMMHFMQSLALDYFRSLVNPKTIEDFRCFVHLLQVAEKKGLYASIGCKIQNELNWYFSKSDNLSALNQVVKSIHISRFPEVYQSFGFQAWRAETIEESLRQHRFFAGLSSPEERGLALVKSML